MWARLTSNQISRRQNLDIPRFLQLVDKPSLCGQRFIYAGGARGGKAHLESDQMSRKALPCKACVERSDYFRAARRHKNNDIISGCRKKPEAFSTAWKKGLLCSPFFFRALVFSLPATHFDDLHKWNDFFLCNLTFFVCT